MEVGQAKAQEPFKRKETRRSMSPYVRTMAKRGKRYQPPPFASNWSCTKNII